MLFPSRKKTGPTLARSVVGTHPPLERIEHGDRPGIDTAEDGEVVAGPLAERGEREQASDDAVSARRRFDDAGGTGSNELAQQAEAPGDLPALFTVAQQDQRELAGERGAPR